MNITPDEVSRMTDEEFAKELYLFFMDSGDEAFWEALDKDTVKGWKKLAQFIRINFVKNVMIGNSVSCPSSECTLLYSRKRRLK